MNEHLRPVFQILLPDLERAEIKYWVYGGVSRAALVGRFVRRNDDVDIFVKRQDFDSTEAIFRHSCHQNGFRLRRSGSLRPKLEVIDKTEILSVVPVFLEDGLVKFRFRKNGSAEYPCQILAETPRSICGYRFFAPPNEYIRDLFKRYLTLRPDVIRRREIWIDAKEVLTPDEFRAFFRQ
jgi:hypothetical protein